MLTIRRAQDRGHANHGWLDTHHTFSFADYYDPAHMGFRSLRVINDDTVDGGQGFGAHGHRDMEIISYVLEGALAHKDSTGTSDTIRPGDVQRMSAGTGVMHSEFNGSSDEPVHFLQIWLIPDKRGIQPSYEQKRFEDGDKRGKLRLVASPDARDGSLTIHTDASVYAGLFDKGERAELSLAPGRHGWIHVARGKVTINGQALGAGDGVAISNEAKVSIEGVDQGEVIAFDLA
ncbi:MAG: pirin family protein [Kofleriaceae bacterium]|nr:pirin family protein [Kofleriaceae bacterium]